MASAKLYVRPIGLLYGATAAEAVAEGLALPLAGGPIAFTAAELIEGVPGNTRMRLFTAHALVSSGEADLASLLARITAPRPPFAGMALDRQVLMGILNVTPDSFSDGGLHASLPRALEAGIRMAAAGAGLIDVGGESTRPGADRVSAAEEADRVLPVIEALRREVSIRISIDTMKAGVAREALAAGADLLNDVSALADPEMLPLLVASQAPVVLMHMRGDPRTMQGDTRYDDVVRDVTDFLRERAEIAVNAGVADDRILLDPGIGFGKSAAGSRALLGRLPALGCLGRPLVIGASRKSFIGATLGLPAGERFEASLALAVYASVQGAHVVRVHDVEATVRAVRMIDALRET